MPPKNKNEILEEQRRAREEFLKLKKMQNGELSADPKPSEVAIIPRTPKEKLINFWFHFKWHVISITAIIIILAVLISQCASRIDYDSEIIYFTYSPVLDSQLHKVEEYFKQYSSDINGDGEVHVQVINCSVSTGAQGDQYHNAQLQKLQAIMAADEKAMLFITDEKSIKYFDNLSSADTLFIKDPLPLDQAFYEYTESEDYGPLPEGLQLSCRRIADTLLGSDDEATVIFKEANRVLEEIEASHNN